MASLHLVTGYKGTAHITSADQGAFNAGCVGADEYVFTNGKRFSAEALSATSVRIYDGCLMMQGRVVRLDPDTYLDVAITSGTASTYRNDMIVVRYTKDTTTGVENVGFIVIKGSATTGTAVDPSYNTGSILDGATVHDMPLYRVRLNGTSIASVEPLFDLLAPMSAIGSRGHNLIINGDFNCNQRGSTTYSASTSQYTLDMWRAYQVKVDVLNEGVTITGLSSSEQGYFTQFVYLNKGSYNYNRTFTLSAMVDDKLRTFTFQSPDTTGETRTFDNCKIAVLCKTHTNSSDEQLNYLKVNICPIGTNTVTVKYIDLFESSVPHAHVKEDYGIALMRAKRYVQRAVRACPIVNVHSGSTSDYKQYRFCLPVERMANGEDLTLDSCSWSYFDGATNILNTYDEGDLEIVLKDEAELKGDTYVEVRSSDVPYMSTNSACVRANYTLTCEPDL